MTNVRRKKFALNYKKATSLLLVIHLWSWFTPQPWPSVLLVALAMPVGGHSVTSHLGPLAAAPTIHLAVIIHHSKLSDLEELRLYNVNFHHRYRAAQELK